MNIALNQQFEVQNLPNIPGMWSHNGRPPVPVNVGKWSTELKVVLCKTNAWSIEDLPPYMKGGWVLISHLKGEEIPFAQITGDVAKALAESQGMPAKNPVFELTLEGKEIYMSYNAGLDYNENGYTFEKEWKLWPPEG